MKLEKSPPELERLFDQVFPADARAERRKMFGYAAGFVNGNHFGGLFADQLVLRLGQQDRQLIAEQGGQQFMPMGHPMTGYVSLPRDNVDEPERLREWLQRAFEYAAAMPPKKPRAAKAEKTPKTRKAAR